MATIYERLLAAGVPLDHHESDLYVLVTEESSRIIGAWRKEGDRNVSTFTSQLDGQVWYEIPFAFDPFWATKSR